MEATYIYRLHVKLTGMSTVIVSSKYQVVIPEEIRSRLKLKAGQKVVMLEKDGVVHVIPVRPMREVRGFAKGVDTKDIRDESDRV